MTPLSRAYVAALVALMCTLCAESAYPQTHETFMIRGRPQVVHLYGVRGGIPFVVSSGDGGWMHLGPHVAEALAANGHFVVGFDVKAYLESFSGLETLRPDDVPGDYNALLDFAAKGGTAKPILIGVSEGAGLSVLAATDPRVKSAVAGVIGLGLPDQTELGWHWKDSIIYITHGTPHEPFFSTAAIVDRLTPTPLAAIQSTHDEYVPLREVQEVLDRASEPKKLWLIDAANHRFSDKQTEFDQRLAEAVDWISAHSPKW